MYISAILDFPKFQKLITPAILKTAENRYHFLGSTHWEDHDGKRIFEEMKKLKILNIQRHLAENLSWRL